MELDQESAAELDKVELELAQTEALLERLKTRQQAILHPPNAYTLADLLHQTQCHYNHTDMCGWFYGEWTDEVLCDTRKRYLEKATALLESYDYDTIVGVLELM